MSNEHAPFFGTGWAFPPTFSRAAGGAHVVSGVEDIGESLRILLSTSLGERLLNPTYGCDLRRYLFEPLDTQNIASIRDLVETSILYHEPRIRPESVTIEDRPLEGAIHIHVEFTLRASNSRHNFVYPFYKNEGSEVLK